MIFIIPVNSWEYNDRTPSDTMFETFGPRADRLLIKLYSDEQLMWNALEQNQIDITDQPLTKTQYDKFITSPFNDTINVIPIGAKGIFYILDINNNNNEFLGNPPNPAYPNPVYPNPCSVLGMRKAIAYLCDRNYIINNITGPFGYPLYTPLLPSSKKFVHPDIRPGGLREDLCYLYSRAMANASLDSSGFAEKDAEGWRIWNVTGQRLVLKFWIKTTDPARKAFGNFLANELEAVGIKVDRIYYPTVIIQDPGMKKDFHLNTGGWIFDMDPDCLLVWHWDYYWHPGRGLNLPGCNDPVYNEAVEAVLGAVSPDEAVAPAYIAQERFAENVFSVPLWCSVDYQAMSRRYVGTPGIPDEEDMWEGQYWEGVTQPNIDNFFSFLNMHPKNAVKGDGSHVTIRYGFSTSELYMLNPIYAEWSWDNKVLDLMYESLLVRNPYNLNEFVPWLAKTYKIEWYYHPGGTYHGQAASGIFTKVKVTLRPDIYWSDGTPLTTADVYFTLVEMDDILRTRFPSDPIVFCPWLDWILSFKIYDPYNFEILFNTMDVWVAGRVCTSRILPRHVWEPICRTGDPITFAPDPNFVATGPWRLKEYVEGSHVELVRNSRGSTVQTNLPGSTPVTSVYGYFKDAPLEVSVYGDGYKARFTPKSPSPHVWLPVTISFTVTLWNLWHGGNLVVDKYLYVDDVLQTGYPITDISLASLTFHEEHFNLTYERCKHAVKVAVYIKEPAAWSGEWVNVTLYFWVTLVTDIYGDFFSDPWLKAPNCKVDMGDIGLAANAFGAYPGHKKWGLNCYADVNNDYKIDMKDIALIAKDIGFGT